MARGRTIAIATFALVWPEAGRAETRAPPVRLEYSAASGCPLEEDFTERVHARTPRLRLAAAGDAARTFIVGLHERSADTYVGDLTVREIDGRMAQRSITGATCDEVATALAVILSIELNPEVEPVPPPAPPERVVPEPPFEPRWGAGAFLDVGVTGALARVVSVTGEIGVELRRESERVVAPSFRFGVAYSHGATVSNAEGSANLIVFAPTVEGCPVQGRFLRRRVALEACGNLEFGVAFADGSPNSGVGRQDLDAWLAIGAEARALMTVREPFFLEISGGLTAPLVRNRFYVSTPTETLFEPPTVAFRSLLGLGVHFL